MKITNAFASDTNTDQLVKTVIRQLDDANLRFDAIIGYFNVSHDAKKIHELFSSHYDCPIMLASSCNGAFSLSGGKGDCFSDMAVFAISDPNGCYGIGYSHTHNKDPKIAAQEAINSALENSGLNFETPTIVWSIMPPGNEESLLEGYASVIGHRVPIFGGSSADNDVSGNWFQMTSEKTANDLIIALVMQPSQPIGYSYSSGYHPTDTVLVANGCDGRTVNRLNNIKASVEYDSLTDHSIAHALDGGNVLSDTTLHPLGKLISSSSDIPEYLLSHPDSVTKSGGLSFFSEVKEGEVFQLMEGSIEGLTNRAAGVIKNAIELLPEGSEPGGILMIYCAGCMLTVDESIKSMQEKLQEFIGDIPIVGAYTFGEQGCFLDGNSRHGNLMISAVIFSK